MTHRPRSIVLISISLGISFLFFFFVPVARRLSGYMPGTLGTIVGVAWFVFMVVFLVRLAELRAPYVRVSVLLAGAWAVWLAVWLTALAPPATLAPGARVTVGVIIALNAASAWYLASPRFRALARQYRLEQDQAAAVRLAQRAIRKSVST